MTYRATSSQTGFMRAWRAKQPQSAPRQRVEKTRDYTEIKRRRGFIDPERCQCGNPEVELCQPDPRSTRLQWLCIPCQEVFIPMATGQTESQSA